MTPQERAKLARRVQGKRNRAQEIADIEKTPEPMQPTKDLGNGHFIAHYTGTAQADYKGFLMGGRAVNFEAKYTDTGRMAQDRVTEDQADRLERAHRYGAHAFVLCSFGAVAFYRVPWEVWRGHDRRGEQQKVRHRRRWRTRSRLLEDRGVGRSCCPHRERVLWSGGG